MHDGINDIFNSKNFLVFLTFRPDLIQIAPGVMVAQGFVY